MTIFLGRTVTVEQILSGHVSPNVLEELAQDRRLELDHDDSTQFNLRVSKGEKQHHVYSPRPCRGRGLLVPASV